MSLARALVNVFCGLVIGCGLATSGFSFWPGTGTPIDTDSMGEQGSEGNRIQYQDAALVFTLVMKALMAVAASLFTDYIIRILWVLVVYSMKGAYFYILQPVPWALAAVVLMSPTGTFVDDSLEMAFALLVFMQGLVFTWAFKKILNAADKIDRQPIRRSQRKRGKSRTLARKGRQRATPGVPKAKSSIAVEMTPSSPTTVVAAIELKAANERPSETLELQVKMNAKDEEWAALLGAKQNELAEVRKVSECALDAACESLKAAEETVLTTLELLGGGRTSLKRAVAGLQPQIDAKHVDQIALLRSKATQGTASARELGAAHEELVTIEKELAMALALLDEERTSSAMNISDFRRQLKTKEAGQTRAVGNAEARRDVSNPKDEMMRDCMALVTDQGNNSLALMRMLEEANRTIRGATRQVTLKTDEVEAVKKDNEKKDAEIARLEAQIARLLGSNVCLRTVSNPPSSNLKPPLRKDMVFFGDETVMDGENVSPALGKGITPNNGSASTLACTISPGGSSVASVVRPLVLPSSWSSSSPSSGTASPPCQPESDKAPRKRTGSIKRKAKREKKKAAELAAMLARVPEPSSDADPDAQC